MYTGNSAPVRERMRRTPLGLEEEEEKHLKDLLNREVIHSSSSEWSAAPVLVRKKDGKIRYCIDYRKLNSITRKDAFPIPKNRDLYRHFERYKIATLRDCSYCSRAQKVWSSFEDDVDYVVPLSVRSVSEQDEDLDETNLDSLVNCNWISESEITNMGAEQMEDQELNRLIVWLEDKIEPEEHEVYLCSPSIKHLWNCKHQLVLKNGILCYKWLDPFHSRLLLVVSRSLRHKILENCHDTKLSEHFGQTNTIERLKQNYIWYGLRENARNYVKSCHTCNVNKKANVKPKGPLGQFHAGIPMEKLHMDILGPLHESSSANKYVLVLVDQFTKWMEMFPLPNQNTITVAKRLLDGFISRLGCPVQIHTDQGKNVDGQMFHDICRLLQIVKTRTTPYRPCSNGQVERFNRTILQAIRCYLKGKQKDCCSLRALCKEGDRNGEETFNGTKDEESE
ncbi:Hypothetical predicted protein [Mytilus galloprovincialis]|uniref:Integrase catalytic domain-containing protein n=1 Tax=Mytilus galloprovincialis TaxID=29158 RepID=A0A8B6FBT8_MYTGA|nr:Hypothetical predicted protein [Mytilus galloprovincialis]